ncbi:MAG: glycosyltransferase family 4 protein [Oscillospiraceae bacterium]|nr:glycosyltransferase family 4 protein [Oscillospiraceae bacterium]
MKRVLILASVASMIEMFNLPNIKLLQELGYKVDAACNFEDGSNCSTEVVEGLKRKLQDIDVSYYQIDFERNVTRFDKHMKAYKQVLKIMKDNNYAFIHCHTPIGGVIGRLCAKKTGTKVIYTAHGFHFFKGAPRKNWILYYPIEKYCSRFTDVLITINKEDYDLAKRKMKAGRIEYIPGVGVDIEKFDISQADRIEKRKELGIPDEAIIILSVGELNKNKNHITVIESLKNVKDNVHYVIAGKGTYENILIEKAKELGISERVHLIGFRNDMAEIYKTADIFVFPSYREGLSVALMEAMANKLPVVCGRIRGNVDLADENKGGYLCTSDNSDEFGEKINRLAQDEELRKQFGEYNAEKIKRFDIKNVMKKMKIIYEPGG